MLERWKKIAAGLAFGALLTGCAAFYLNNLDLFRQAVADWLRLALEQEGAAAEAYARGDIAAGDTAYGKLEFACDQLADLAGISNDVVIAEAVKQSNRQASQRLQVYENARDCERRLRLAHEEVELRKIADNLRRHCGCPGQLRSDEPIESLGDCDISSAAAALPSQDNLPAALSLAIRNAGGDQEAGLRAYCQMVYDSDYKDLRFAIDYLYDYCSNEALDIRRDVETGETLAERIAWRLKGGSSSSSGIFYRQANEAHEACQALLWPAGIGGVANASDVPPDFDQEPLQTPGGYVPPPTGDPPIIEPPIGEPPVLDPPQF